MPKTASPELFNLIHSMTRPEKAYFKAFTGSHGLKVPDYVRLFNVLSKMERNDEKKVISALKSIPPTRLARLKNYLYDLVLQGLESFHSKHSVSAEIEHLLLRAKLLAEKGLFTQGQKTVDKCKKLARDNYLNMEMFDSLLQEYALVISLGAESADQAFWNCHDALTSAVNEIRYKNASWIIRTGCMNPTDIENNRERVTALINSELFSSESMALSIPAKTTFNQNLFLYHFFFSRDLSGCKHYCWRSLEIMESEPSYLQANFTAYISLLNNFAIGCTIAGDYKSITEVVLKLKSLDRYKLSAFNKARVRMFAHSFELTVIKESSFEFEKMPALLEEFCSDIRTLQTIPHRKMEALFLAACHYFFLADYKNSLGWNNKLMSCKPKFLKDLLCWCRILNLFLHYEIGNTDLLPYLSRSAKRYLVKQDFLSKRMAVLIDFFGKKVLDHTSAKEIREEFIALKKKLNALPTSGSNVEREMCIPLWIESKINGISFAEAVKRNGGIVLKESSVNE